MTLELRKAVRCSIALSQDFFQLPTTRSSVPVGITNKDSGSDTARH